jgi:HlyD family secretion protein
VMPSQPISLAWLVCMSLAAASCEEAPPADRARVSGQVEATDVHVSAPVGGRILELGASEGGRVEAGALIARLDTADAELALTRTKADRSQADAQLRLLRAGSRVEDIHQAEAQLDAARSEVAAAKAELTSAQGDVDRFEALLASNSGSKKQRDDAVAHRDVARERLAGSGNRVASAQASLTRLKAGARPEEIAAAVARVAAADAQIAIWEKAIADASVTAPLSGIVSDVIADRGELVAPRAPIAVITDLDHAWANVYVDEPVVPRLRLGQSATIYTDAGGDGITGKVTYIASTAEFTPRNVQTAEDRSQLVYRVKVSVDNTSGILKSGMPVEADLPFQP